MDAVSTKLQSIVRSAKPPKVLRGAPKELSIAFFDLSDSTARKLDQGHLEGVKAALEHGAICKALISHFGGKFIKDLGDGVLATFPDPLKALVAALNIAVAVDKRAKLSTKIGLTTGLVEVVKIGSRSDVLGNAVDRCARLQSLASSGQIIIDRPFYESVRSFIPGYPDIRVEAATIRDLKGIGETEVRVIRSKFVRSASPMLHEGFFMNEGGRLPMAEKVRLMRQTRAEVIEVGLGLTTFASYFHSFDRALFKEPVRELIRAGVSFKCLVLDASSAAARLYMADQNESAYRRDIGIAMTRLREVKEEFVAEKLTGSFEMYTYSHLPSYHALCIDIGESEPNSDGTMIVSNYLFGTKRADCPVMRFSSRSNPRLFETYWCSVRQLLREGDRRW